MNSTYPKISIVTPVFNQVDYLEQTILSVLNQDYPNIEYFVIDGGSTDGTLEIIKTYEDKITKWISEPDHGMYHAINKGFDLSTGDIMCWINSDDILLPYSLFNMATLFEDMPNVDWIQGLNSVIDLNGNIISTLSPKKFSLITFLNGNYKWIQQESTFWRRSLWEKAEGKLNQDLKLAGDFELWFRFFQFEKLFYVNIPVGAWRKRPGQLSTLHKDVYLQEAASTIKSYNIKKEEMQTLKKVKRYEFFIYVLQTLKVFKLNHLINLRNKFSNLHNIDIRYSYKHQKFQLSTLK